LVQLECSFANKISRSEPISIDKVEREVERRLKQNISL